MKNVDIVFSVSLLDDHYTKRTYERNYNNKNVKDLISTQKREPEFINDRRRRRGFDGI